MQDILGISPNARYRARSERRAPKCPQRFNKSTNASVLVCYLKTARHLGRRDWTDRDREVIAELKARSWTVAEISTQKDRVLEYSLSTFAVRERYGRDVVDDRIWRLFSLLADAYRAGALGLMVSYDDLAAELGCSRATWGRMQRYLLKERLIQVIRVREERPDAPRGYNNGRNLYQFGDKILSVMRFGLLEKGQSSESSRRIRDEAQAARQASRRHRAQRAQAERKAANEARCKWRDGNPSHPQADRLDLPRPDRAADEKPVLPAERQVAEPTCEVGASAPLSPSQFELTSPGVGGGDFVSSSSPVRKQNEAACKVAQPPAAQLGAPVSRRRPDPVEAGLADPDRNPLDLWLARRTSGHPGIEGVASSGPACERPIPRHRGESAQKKAPTKKNLAGDSGGVLTNEQKLERGASNALDEHLLRLERRASLADRFE